jgi:DNA-binding SARP family transcriptional activator
MKSIKFSENELEFLKNHYEMELADAENYVIEIRNILKKLNTSVQVKAAEEKPAKKSGRKPGRPKSEAKTTDVKPEPKTRKKGKKTRPKAPKAKKNAVAPEPVDTPAPVVAAKKPAAKKPVGGKTKKAPKKPAKKTAAPAAEPIAPATE